LEFGGQRGLERQIQGLPGDSDRASKELLNKGAELGNRGAQIFGSKAAHNSIPNRLPGERGVELAMLSSPCEYNCRIRIAGASRSTGIATRCARKRIMRSNAIQSVR
jgi:hypothetical protein